MDLLKQLKNLLKIPGNRVIIVEEGKPSYVLTTIEDYLQLVGQQNAAESQSSKTAGGSEAVEDKEDWREQVNQILTEVAEKESSKETPEVEEGDKETKEEIEELKVEDLPF